MSKRYAALIILIVFLTFSCKNQTSNPEKEKSQTKEGTSQEPPINSHKIIELLQGEWKEPEYPYRTVEFKRKEVKFTEEGVVKKPRFKKFEISNKCPFDVNNIKRTNSTDLIFSIPENETCEKLEVTDSTLVFYGYNTHTENDYKIVYEKSF